jgi:4-hydroxy-3-methylbut-2-enyl diphosphate reductase IspH
MCVPEWLREASVVGLTAGTSTPDDVIDRVEARLYEIASAGQPAQVRATGVREASR